MLRSAPTLIGSALHHITEHLYLLGGVVLILVFPNFVKSFGWMGLRILQNALSWGLLLELVGFALVMCMLVAPWHLDELWKYVKPRVKRYFQENPDALMAIATLIMAFFGLFVHLGGYCHMNKSEWLAGIPGHDI